MFVPTIDIDLIWHTHQCWPVQYYTTTREIAGIFVNHDDNIKQDTLDIRLVDTKTLYRVQFGEDYHICGCLRCEAVESALEKADGELDFAAIEKDINEQVQYYKSLEVARRAKSEYYEKGVIF